jgi:hypothetical protein
MDRHSQINRSSETFLPGLRPTIQGRRLPIGVFEMTYDHNSIDIIYLDRNLTIEQTSELLSVAACHLLVDIRLALVDNIRKQDRILASLERNLPNDRMRH